MNNFTHNSVLLTESIKSLNIKKDGVYIDATFGRGGHTLEIIKYLNGGKVIAIDKDLEAIKYAENNIVENNIEVIHSDFCDIIDIVKEKKLLGKIDGILLDLGVSSPQLDDKSRGFSFIGDNELDMRMNQTCGQTAQLWLKSASEKEIADVLFNYGEERRSRIIAKKIKEFQQNNELTTTKQLTDIINKIIKKTNKKNPATRSFQAIRIHINNELGGLRKILTDSIKILKPGGRLVVITFHSLEDRIVKQFIQQNSTTRQVPKGLPIIDQDELIFKSLKKQKPSADEVKINIRSRSSILRVAERC